MKLTKKIVNNIKSMYYYPFKSGSYKKNILKSVQRIQIGDLKLKYFFVSLEGELEDAFWSEQVVGLRDKDFDYKYRATERWWGYLDAMYRYEIERGLEGEIDTKWYIERLKKVYGEEVYSKKLEEIIKKVVESREEVFDEYKRRKYVYEYIAISIYFGKKFFQWDRVKGEKEVENERYTWMEFLKYKYDRMQKPAKKDTSMEIRRPYKAYIEGLYKKKKCKKVRKAYEEYVKARNKLNRRILFRKNLTFDTVLTYMYQLGVKRGYKECLEDVATNDKIVYKEEFLKNPLF
jgi:hypothetical protein